MTLATRCPICEALFRVSPDQLRARGGQVRCGHCKAVFDGLAHLVPESDRPASWGDETAAALRAEVEAAASNARGAPRVAVEPAVTATASSAFESSPPPAPAADGLRREWRTVALSAFLLLLLAAQLALWQRDMLAAEHPALRGVLVALCGIAGCEVRLPQAVDRLSIEGDEMTAPDAKDPSRILLLATLRNSAPFPVAYPSLELSLQNAREEILARRVLGPADYLAPGSDMTGGLAAHGDVDLRLALDTGAMRAEGYRLYLFYP